MQNTAGAWQSTASCRQALANLCGAIIILLRRVFACVRAGVSEKAREREREREREAL